MSKPKLILLILLSLCFASVYSQTYPFSAVPDSLKLNAILVVRNEIREIEMNSANSGTEKITRILTILNKRGEDLASMAIYYDKNSSVKINEIVFFDSNWKELKNVKQSEITDSPIYGSSQLYSETRVKTFQPLFSTFPYTIRYVYEIKRSNIISFAGWYPITNYNVSVQHSELLFTHPMNVKINGKEVNTITGITETHTSLIKKRWELNNLKAIEAEPYSISLKERVPAVYLMPSVLIYDKYRGSADKWTEYGKWIYSLYEARDVLSETEKLKVEEIINVVPDTLQKIIALYKYMQERTRYVGIQMGIGGFQPFDATTVYETGYGDCKALSNYMYSLLKFIGIKSYPAIVSSGRYKENIFLDFPNFQQFDHAILCVPNSGDTIWLECTDQKMPFGFLGDFTDDRDVLLITESGGKFAHTTKYRAKDNIRTCKSEFTIDSEGTANGSVSLFYKGLEYDGISSLLRSNNEEQKKWLYSNSSLPSLQIKSFDVTDFKEMIPAARVKESLVSKNYCSFSGKYMLLPLNIINAQGSVQKMLKPRLSDILINRTSVEMDTILFKIPQNYKIESLPSGNTINSDFGSYSWSVTASETEIVYTRKLIMLEGRYKPADYKKFYDFILSVSKADNTKILLTKT